MAIQLKNKSYTPTTASASLTAFTASGNTVLNGLYVFEASAGAVANVYLFNAADSTVSTLLLDTTVSSGMQIISSPIGMQAGDQIRVNVSRTGPVFTFSYALSTSAVSGMGLDALTDVNASSPSTNDVLQWNGSSWIAAVVSGGGGSSTFDALTDTDLTSVTTSDFIKWNGTDWVNFSPTTADISESGNLYYSDSRVNANLNVAANTAKVGYTSGLFAADFNAKTTADLQEASGSKYYTEARVSANTDVTANSAKISYTDAAAVTANTAKISYTDAAAVALNTAKDTYPTADSDKVGHISVTQAVNLDTMESTIASNTGMAGAAATAAVNASSSLSNHTTSIENHADVTFAYTGLNRPDGAHLVWDTDHWGEEVSGLDHLADVDLTTTAPSVNDILEWDGTNWVPTAPPTGGGSANVTIDANTTPSNVGDYNDGATIMNLTSVSATVAAGKPFYLGSSGWTFVSNSNATATANVIAMCTSDSTTGSSMLREGVIKVSDNLTGSVGDKVYLHTGSKLTTTEPTSSATVREMGVLLDATNNIIYFKPSDVSLTIS